ncbi:MAG: deiodinase-like protein [Planctomycetota bacterium]
MNQVDSLERMYQEYKSIAEFRVVYIQEAHAADGRRPSGLAIHLGINEHTTVAERCTEAKRLMEDKTLTIPMLIDNIDDEVSLAYSAHPDRFFVVRSDGRLAVAATRGPHGFNPAMQQGQEWLAEFKRTGEEPELSEEAIAAADEKSEERRQRLAQSATESEDGAGSGDVNSSEDVDSSAEEDGSAEEDSAEHAGSSQEDGQ